MPQKSGGGALAPSHIRARGEVGYRKPPKSAQFKTGQSGNPSGRRKGVRNFETDLQETLRSLVEVWKAGGVRRITTQEASLQMLAEKVMIGDQRAIEHLIGLILRCKEKIGEAPVIAVNGNDRAILDEYYADRKAPRGQEVSRYPAPPNLPRLMRSLSE